MTPRNICVVHREIPAPDGLETFLCSYRNHFFYAPADMIDRTKEIRCPACTRATLPAWWDEKTVEARLRGITT